MRTYAGSLHRSLLIIYLSWICLSIGAITAIAAPTTDPVLGTWRLNVAKSFYSSGLVPKSETRTYEGSYDTNDVSWSGINAAGQSYSYHNAFKLDGMDYPTDGTQDYDAIAAKRINAYLVTSVLKRSGTIVGHSRRVVSRDGTALTITTNWRNAQGIKFREVRVYDRQ
jgi:hypothetical protein